jgi:hypothetical protein
MPVVFSQTDLVAYAAVLERVHRPRSPEHAALLHRRWGIDRRRLAAARALVAQRRVMHLIGSGQIVPTVEVITASGKPKKADPEPMDSLARMAADLCQTDAHRRHLNAIAALHRLGSTTRPKGT